MPLRRHWSRIGAVVTACGRPVSGVRSTDGNPEVVDCGQCRNTFDYSSDLRMLQRG